MLKNLENGRFSRHFVRTFLKVFSGEVKKKKQGFMHSPKNPKLCVKWTLCAHIFEVCATDVLSAVENMEC